MFKYFTILIFMIVIFIVYFLFWKVPQYNKAQLNEFAEFLEGFLLNGRDRGVYVIEHEPTKYFVQFVKKSDKQGKFLSYGFPDTDWSRKFFTPLIEAFKKNNIEYEIINTESKITQRFIIIEPIRKSGEAMKILEITIEILGLPKSSFFKVELK